MDGIALALAPEEEERDEKLAVRSASGGPEEVGVTGCDDEVVARGACTVWGAVKLSSSMVEAGVEGARAAFWSNR